MKKIFLFYCIPVLFLFSSCSSKSDKDMIKVISLNVRYDNAGDSLNPWNRRAPIICNLIKSEKPDVFGFQEVLYSQYEYFDSLLTNYGSAGVGRVDGIREGEMTPIYYLKSRFDLIRSKTFWLSETPEKPGSISWESSLPRIVTWIELSEKNTHEHFFVFNTHFAHDSDSARIMSSRLLLAKVDSIASGFPFIITGDFNMLHSSKGYKILTGPFESVPLMIDTYASSEKRHMGPAYTYNGFSEKTEAGRVDYIFVRNEMRVLENRTLIRKEHGIYISDHWPVMSVVSVNMPGQE